MADLQALDALHVWMVARGVTYARCGELELRLLPPALAPAAVEELPPLSPAEERRRSIEALLWSSGADPTPFLGVDQ